MLWQMGSAIGDFASSFVFSPRVWSGLIVVAAAGVLFVVSGSLRRSRARKARGSTPGTGATAGPGPGGASAPTKALKPAKNKPPADDDLADVADILRRHNIH
jgi:hypothetical protein